MGDIVGEVDVALYRKVTLSSSDGGDRVHLYKVVLGEGSEAVVDSWLQKILEELDFAEGTCADHDYSVADGSEKLDLGIVGEIDVALYKKVTLSSSNAGDRAHLYKVVL